jgi:hypothetical protein
LWQGQISTRPAGSRELAAASDPCGPYPVRARRISDAREERDGTRVLVDCPWPRGSRKAHSGLGYRNPQEVMDDYLNGQESA